MGSAGEKKKREGVQRARERGSQKTYVYFDRTIYRVISSLDILTKERNNLDPTTFEFGCVGA